MTDFNGEANINDLPELVLIYILSILAPYNDLDNCKRVNRYWCYLVRGVVKKRKQNFIKALKNKEIIWKQIGVGTEQGLNISRRYAHSACIHKDSLYVFGGCTYGYTTYNDLWRFDLSSREWIRPLTTGTYPSPKACASMISFKDDIWLYGGWTHPSPLPYHQELKIYKEFHSYNSSTNKWTVHVSNVQPPSSAGHSASLQKNRYMVIFGGLQLTGVGFLYESSNTIWVYDMESQEWSCCESNQPRPSCRYGHSQIAINDSKMLIMGGSGGPNMRRNDVWLLTMPDELDDLWIWQEIQVQNFPSKMSLLWCNPAVKVDSHIIVLSGENASSSLNFPISSRPVSGRIQNAHVSDRNCHNAGNTSPGNSGMKHVELNVNGKKGTFKRRYNSNTDGCSSQHGASSMVLDDQSQQNGVDIDNKNSNLNKNRLNEPKLMITNNRIHPSIRMNASNDRERRLEMLRFYENRLHNPLPQQNIHAASTIEDNNLCQMKHLRLHSIDITDLLESNALSWSSKPMSQYVIESSPHEIIRYSLNVGNSELILFGGVQKDSRLDVPSSQVNDIVSNTIHFITAKPFSI